MALHWGDTEKLAIYLKGVPQFMLLMENLGLTYLAQKAWTNRLFARWTIELTDYDFKICHRLGKLNKADALSRLHGPKQEPESLQFKVTASRNATCLLVLSGNNRLREYQTMDADCRHDN